MSKSTTAAFARAKRRKVEELTKGFRGLFVFLFSMSGLINVLALTGSFYMLQVYDRALTSGSVPTLLALSVLAIGLYFFQGLFAFIKQSYYLCIIGAQHFNGIIHHRHS